MQYLFWFTGVVGYQTAKSSTVAKASPLFTVRSSRAIDGESKSLNCDYVGKGEEITVLLPKRDDKQALMQKFRYRISKMNDKTFKAYLNLIINKMRKNDKYDEVNINEVITTIQQLRGNPERINLHVYKNGDITYIKTPTYCWLPGCLVLWIIWIVQSTMWAFGFPFCNTYNCNPL